MIKTKRALALLPMALVAALSTVLVAGSHPQKAAAAGTTRSAPRTGSARTFADEFVGVTNEYAKEHGSTDRVSNADCVRAAPGRYMCSYVITRNGTPTCHLMQARWTPGRSAAITVTLAGRTARCATLNQALRSLR
jgi:hypothetical protein